MDMLFSSKEEDESSTKEPLEMVDSSIGVSVDFEVGDKPKIVIQQSQITIMSRYDFKIT